jgi:DNA-binding transcriptional LysR family regulator
LLLRRCFFGVAVEERSAYWQAECLGIKANQKVLIASRRGQVTATVFVINAVQAGQLFISMHYSLANELTFPAFDPYSTAACLQSLRCFCKALVIAVVDVNRIPSILLQTFLTVAEAGQISEAARRLHLSQPTVTGHIRRLEANLETTLFIRSANGVSLTERGARLRERVQDVFVELEQILRELDRTREVNGTLTLAASTTVARYFVPRIFIRFHQYRPAAALHLIVGNTEEVLDHLRQQRVGLGLVEGHQRSPGVHLEQFMPDEIVPVCAPRIPDPKLRRAIEGLKSVRDLEVLPLIWRESGSGTRAVVESVLKDGGVNPRKLDQRFELGSNEAIKSLVIGGLGVGFFSCWDIQPEIGMGLVRQINIPGLRIQRMFSWALPSGELGGLPGEFYQFANSIRSELSAVSVHPLKEPA